MRKTANDWMLTIASAVFSYQLARLHTTSLMIPAVIAVLTIIAHFIFLFFFEKKYLTHRWQVTGILCGANLLTGLIISLV